MESVHMKVYTCGYPIRENEMHQFGIFICYVTMHETKNLWAHMHGTELSLTLYD
jgi:hypothetical protein